MRFMSTVKTADPESLPALRLQRGQWINYCGARGRWVGVSQHGDIRIAWAASATKRFAQTCAVANSLGCVN